MAAAAVFDFFMLPLLHWSLDTQILIKYDMQVLNDTQIMSHDQNIDKMVYFG